MHELRQIALSTVTFEQLADLVQLTSRGVTAEPWQELSRSEISDEERMLLGVLVRKLGVSLSMSLDEATVWSRAVYPMLMLAEDGGVRAWAQVPIDERLASGRGRIFGVLDGVLAPESPIGGAPDRPYLLVIEAKRGLGAPDPRPQLLASLIAACIANQRARPSVEAPTVQYGCYTVGDVWTFVEATYRFDASADVESLALRYSAEMDERHEAEAILRLLKGISQRAAAHAS